MSEACWIVQEIESFLENCQRLPFENISIKKKNSLSGLETQIQKQASHVPSRFDNPGALPGCQAFRGFCKLEKKTI